jgi:uncharacterized protein DUF6941
MQLDLAVLADMANIDGAGKLNIIGEFNMIPAVELPSPPLTMALVARIVAEASEGPQHRVAIALVDADGRELARIPDQVLQFGGAVPGTSGDLRAQLVVGIMGARFPAYGAYAFHVLVDGRYLGERVCYVVPPVAPRP